MQRTTQPLARRGIVPPAIWQRFPAPDHFVVDHQPHSFEYTNSEGDLNSRALFWLGLPGFEPFATSAATAIFRVCRNVVDVGANTGIYTLAALAAGPDVFVYAFEPVQRFRETLVRNVDANGWADRCQISGNAVDANPGTVEFVLPMGNSPYSARLAHSEYRTSSKDQPIEFVEAVTLDERFKDISVDFIKIDVEGAELAVLRGSATILSRDQPSLLFECHPEAPTADVEGLLLSLDYSIFKLEGPQPTAVASIVPTQDRKLNNFIAIKREAHLRCLQASDGDPTSMTPG